MGSLKKPLTLTGLKKTGKTDNRGYRFFTGLEQLKQTWDERVRVRRSSSKSSRFLFEFEFEFESNEMFEFEFEVRVFSTFFNAF